MKSREWAAATSSFTFFWGIPIAVLVIAIGFDHPARTWMWFAALFWMGLACIGNAVRCSRVHCYVTGPFYIVVTIAVLLHGYRLVWLGPQGWLWLGITLGAGGCLLTVVPERLWGKYRNVETEPKR